LVAFSRDPALAIWQAMKPLAEVDKAAETKFYPRQTATITVAPAISHGMIK